MGTITIRFNDEEEKDNPRNGWRAKFAAQHFSKSIVMENLGNSREDLLQRGVGRVLLNQGFEHDLLLALLKRAYGEKKPPKFGIRLIGKILTRISRCGLSWVFKKTRNLTLPKNTRQRVSRTYHEVVYKCALLLRRGNKKPTFSAGFFYLAAFSFSKAAL